MVQVATSDDSLAKAVSGRAAARLRAFRLDVERVLPGQVESVVLFGSRARGNAQSTSDYDVAVLLGRGERPPRLGHILSDLAFPHVRAGVPIRPIVLTGASVHLTSSIPIARHIARDGIAIV
jgi:hypothetical protein